MWRSPSTGTPRPPGSPSYPVSCAARLLASSLSPGRPKVLAVTPHRLVEEHTAYSCVVGSRAYGLDGPDSDVDRRGVFVAPTPLFWGLDSPPTHVDGPAAEQFSWEVGRCCVLALAANPTVLECLWSPL